MSDTTRIAEEIIRLRVSQMIVNEEYKAKRLKVSVHLALGHETIAVAISEIMQPGDALIPTHRNIAYNLARAGALRPILDEYYLKPTGINGARSGSMNMLNPDRGIIYTSSILGNQFAVATGVAMTKKRSGSKNFTMVLGGDGSMEEGIFYESMLMAKSMQLPVMFIVENNEWSMSTRIDQRRCPIDVAKFAASMDIRYAQLEGNNPSQYIATLKQLREFSVTEHAPVCLEVKLATLGDWQLKTPEHPEGEFINYHAGPAPEVSLNEWPIIRQSDDDPVYALMKDIDRAQLEEMARQKFTALQQEIA